MYDLEYMLNSLTRKPHVIAVTEVNTKVSAKFIISEINIPGYQIFHNIQFQGERGVVLYVMSALSATEVHMSTKHNEAIFIKIAFKDNTFINVGNIYRSPSSSKFDDEQLFNLIEEAVGLSTTFPLRKFFKESLTHGPLNLCVNEKTVRVNDSPYFQFWSHTVPPPISTSCGAGHNKPRPLLPPSECN